jgi:hypothetical protein
MAVSIANLTSGTDVDGGSTASTASITPTANNLVLLTVASRTNITAAANEPTISGNGLTWVKIAGVVFDDTGASRKLVTLFRAMGAIPTAGAIAMDFGGQAQTDIGWNVDQCSGVDTTGANGAGAIVQSATNALLTPNENTVITVTLAAFSSVNNATYGSLVRESASGVDPTVGSGFSQLGLFATASNLEGATEWKATNDTSVDITFGSSVQLGGIAVEIKMGDPALYNHVRGVFGELKVLGDIALGDFTTSQVQGVLGEFKPVIDTEQGVSETVVKDIISSGIIAFAR